MIFLLLILFGIHQAQSVKDVLPFLMCLLLRAAYLQRSLSIITWIPTVFAFLFFIANWWNYQFHEHLELTAHSWMTYPAVVYSVKMLVGSAALIHVAHGTLEYRAKQVPSVGFCIYYGLRAFNMLRTRFWDYYFAYKDLRSSAARIGREYECFKAFIVGFFLEAIMLAKGVSMMIAARGGIPRNSDWQESVPSCRYVWFVSYRVIGDVFLITLLLICIRFSSELANAIAVWR